MTYFTFAVSRGNIPQCSTIPAQEPKINYHFKRFTCHDMLPKGYGLVFSFPIKKIVIQVLLTGLVL